MQTDNLFYRIFLMNPSFVSELLPGVPEGCEFEFIAPVVKEKKFALDGLLSPVATDPSLPLVFLEAQMQREPRFYGRYFAEIFLYLYQYDVVRPWYGLLILPHRRFNLGSDIPYRDLLEGRVKVLFLEDLVLQVALTPNLSLLKLIAVDESEAAPLARQILKGLPDGDIFLQKLDVVEAILVNKFPNLSPQEIIKMLDLPVTSLKQTRFYQDLVKEGRQEGESVLVLRLLRRRCGFLSSEIEDRIKGLSIEQLESLADALLDFGGLPDLEVWLAEV
jgi:predicted transposase YdaD